MVSRVLRQRNHPSRVVLQVAILLCALGAILSVAHSQCGVSSVVLAALVAPVSVPIGLTRLAAQPWSVQGGALGQVLVASTFVALSLFWVLGVVGGQQAVRSARSASLSGLIVAGVSLHPFVHFVDYGAA